MDGGAEKTQLSEGAKVTEDAGKNPSDYDVETANQQLELKQAVFKAQELRKHIAVSFHCRISAPEHAQRIIYCSCSC